MRVFVTGGTGFIGANLIRKLLTEGYEITALVRPESDTGNLKGLDVRIVTGGLNDGNLADLMRGCEALFHVAALYSLWRKDRDQLYKSNVLGTRNLLEAARIAGVARVVYTSSVAAIGTGKNGEIVDENHQSPVEELIGDYKKSKYLAEREAYKAVEMGQDVVIVNPSTPIGPFDIKPTPTGDIICRFLRRRMPAYVDTGLNFIDVGDVATGHILALKKGRTGERYILGNENMTLKEFLNRLSLITGIPAPRITLPLWLPLAVAWIDENILGNLGKKPGVPIDGVRMSAQKMYYSPEKAVRELGLQLSPVDRAIKEAVEWREAADFLDNYHAF